MVANNFTLPGLGSGMESAVGLSADPASMASSYVISRFAKDKDDPNRLGRADGGGGIQERAARAAALHAVVMHNDPSLRTKIAPLMDHKKEQGSYRAAAGYLRLKIIANKSQ
jgi:hypothetical protein